MEEEVEDIVGSVRLTESQKSVSTWQSTAYSVDFTDSGSERRHSSGRDTYVLECSDSSDSGSFPVHADTTVMELQPRCRDAVVQQCASTVSRAAAAALLPAPAPAPAVSTQTSRTILELARSETRGHTLHTQTSFVSITEHTTYTLHLRKKHLDKNVVTVLTHALDDHSSELPPSECDAYNSNSSEVSSDDRIINILDAESKDNILSDDTRDTPDEHSGDSARSDNSLEPDSLMETKPQDASDRNLSEVSEQIPKSIDEEIEALYNKLAERRELHACGRGQEVRHRDLTPLTEESYNNTGKRDSTLELTQNNECVELAADDYDKDVVFTNFAGGKVKILPKEDRASDFKLPPIGAGSCPSSPPLNFLFSVGELRGLPGLREGGRDPWELQAGDLASGESMLVSGKGDITRSNGSIHLPPIHIEGYVVESKISKAKPPAGASAHPEPEEQPPSTREAISIRNRIKELKMARSAKTRSQSRREMRSVSPCSAESHTSKLCEVAERGCDALCLDLMRRLRSNVWYEVSDTLEQIPAALDKFWPVIAENRLADLIRLVSGAVESPRTQVARSACACLAHILHKTNYTKKPDFNEAVAVLLTKTGSFSRPVRRAANMALDTVACGVELSHAVTALALHGAQHKSGVVRSAAARLLVVACALAGGGRGVLRARPPTAAAARVHLLRALAALLDDKNTEARRYAERLYSMLRPLPNFEAYYLTDVEVERATRHMNKYDRSLPRAR